MTTASMKELASSPVPAPLLTLRAGRMFAFIPGSERLAVSEMGALPARVLSLTTGEEIFRLEKPLPYTLGIVASGDGTTFAVAAHAAREAVRDRVILYNAQTGTKIETVRAGHKAELTGHAFAPGSTALLYASSNGLTAIDARLSPAVRSLRVSAEYPENTVYYAVAFSASGDRFASVWWHNALGTHISLFDWPSGEERCRWACSGDVRRIYSSQVLFSPDDQSLLLSMPDGSVAVWSLTAAESDAARIASSAAPTAAANEVAGRLAFSPDGTLLAYAVGSMLGLWAWPSGECLAKWRLPGKTSEVYQLGFSPSGLEVAVSLYNSRSLYLYRVADLLHTRNIHGNQ